MVYAHAEWGEQWQNMDIAVIRFPSYLYHNASNSQTPFPCHNMLLHTTTYSKCRKPCYTLIFIAIPLCGSYPKTLKSSTFHPSIPSSPFLSITSSGNALGTLSTCTLSAST